MCFYKTLLFSRDWLENGEEMHSAPVSVYTRQTARNCAKFVAVGGEGKAPCLLSPKRAQNPLRRPDRLPIALQLGRGLPEGIARYQRIIDQAQQRDDIRNQVNGREDIEERNDQDRLGLFA